MRRILITTVLLSVLAINTPAHATTEIKLAILAPEGTTWHKVMTDWNEELLKKTSGQLRFKIYAGGVLGDERDVIRKMRIGQVHAAGFTGLGLGLVNPAVRVLELPMLVENYEEADALAKHIQPKLEAGFKKKGFVLLAWAETGFVNIFSNKKPISSVSDMERMKMWAWEGDPLVAEMYRVFKIVPIPLPLTDVLTSLQTNLLDAVYAPPLAAIALQWFTHTKYMTDLKLADSTGGILITKRSLDRLSSAHRKVLKKTARKYGRILVERTRAENEKAYDALRRAGLVMVKVPPEEVEHIRTSSRKVWRALAGKLYPETLLNEAVDLVKRYRTSKTEN